MHYITEASVGEKEGGIGDTDDRRRCKERKTKKYTNKVNKTGIKVTTLGIRKKHEGKHW